MDFHQEHLTEPLRISNLNNLKNSFLWVIAILSLYGCVGRTDTKERSPEFHEINYTEVIGCVPVDSAIYRLNITRDS